MTSSLSPRDRVSDLEQRLAARRAAEAMGREIPGAHAHNVILSRYSKGIEPALRLALRAVGLYNRGVRNALQLEVRKLRFTFPDLPQALHGFRILHLSDLHIDGVDGLAEILCERLAGIPADLCVLTGDYRYKTKGPCNRIYPRMQLILSAVRSRHGVLGILGNHDCAEIASELEKLGVRMLINEIAEVLPELSVIGVDEDDPDGFDEAFAIAPRGAFKLALVHTPDWYAEADAAGIGLYLCGHTHAGQVCLPGLGAPILNASCPRSYAHGVWRHGRTQGFTTSGAGCSMLPVRYNCPPEIALIELARG